MDMCENNIHPDGTKKQRSLHFLLDWNQLFNLSITWQPSLLDLYTNDQASSISMAASFWDYLWLKIKKGSMRNYWTNSFLPFMDYPTSQNLIHACIYSHNTVLSNNFELSHLVWLLFFPPWSLCMYDYFIRFTYYIGLLCRLGD